MPKQPTALRPSAETWETRWKTPIGTMTGRLTASGWQSLQFPPAGCRTLPDSPAREIELTSIQDGAGRATQPPPDIRSHLDTMARFLEQYFSGVPPTARPAIADQGRTAFTRAVRRLTAGIPFGTTATYGELAQRANSPGAARAVGQVMARNPLVLVIPCHRVLAGSAAGKTQLGGFSGGLELKRWLLGLESCDTRPA